MSLWIARTLAIVLFGAVTGCGQAPSPTPHAFPFPMRIVSINPCVDAMLVQLVEPRRILAISHYSQTADATSIDLALARRFKATKGTAEEIIALKPDLVVSGPHAALPTIAALKRLGIPLVQLGVPNSVEDSRDHIRALATAVGNEAAGTRLIHRIDGAVTLAQTQANTRLSAIIWQGGGLVPGHGTLADEMLGLAGFENKSSAFGLQKWDVLPLEPLVAQPPDVIMTQIANNQKDRLLSHPIMQKAARHTRLAHFPSRLLNCGGPTIIDAMARLTEIRQDMRP